MSHEVENMFVVGLPAWHRLGTVLPGDTELTIEEAIKLAGLDWTVSLEELQMPKIPHRKVPAKATVRSTDDAVLGVVGTTYRPLQNIDAFRWFQPWLDGGFVVLESAGSLRGGRRVWVLARIVNGGEGEVVKGDVVVCRVLLSNGHDGTLAVRAGFTRIRVECANTMAAAHGSADSKLLRVRHTASVGVAIEQIRDIMSLAKEKFEADLESYRQLARRGVSVEDLKTYVHTVFRPKVVISESEADTKGDRLLSKIVPIFEASPSLQLPGVQGTWWAAYNAVNEYLQHHRGRSDDTRVDSMWFGDGATLNQRALQEALRQAA